MLPYLTLRISAAIAQITYTHLPSGRTSRRSASLAPLLTAATAFSCPVPKEHNAGQSSAERADVNGNNVHPLRESTADYDGNDQTDHTDDAKRLLYLNLKVLRRKAIGASYRFTMGGYACEQYADVEDRADDTAGIALNTFTR